MGNSRLIQWAVAAVFVSMILMELVVVASAYEGGGIERFTLKNRINREFNKNRNAEQGMGRKKWRKGNNRRKKMDTIQLQYLEDNIPFQQRRYREENENAAVTKPKKCCPVVVETIAPISGINQHGEIVHLHRDENNVQRFSEVSCASVNQTCEFLDRQYTPLSRCVQQYSYVYAWVLPKEGEIKHQRDRIHGKLEKIRVRSGCDCEISSNRPNKRFNKRPRRQQDG